MKNPTENDFKSKFRLLNSQEHSEEIIWSCSDSSDYENTKHNESLSKVSKTFNKKRKRGHTRKKTSKKDSNIEISFIDVPSTPQKENCNQRPPLSPILTNSQQHFVPINKNKFVFDSPILSSNRNNSLHNSALKSPILFSKHISPKVSPNVRKKLFNNNNNIVQHSNEVPSGCKSPVDYCTQIDQKIRHKSGLFESMIGEHILNAGGNSNIKQVIIKSDSQQKKFNNIGLNEINIEESSSEEKEIKLETVANKATNNHLIEKVKSYFDIQFSSETSSQHSISEYDSTPKNNSKSSEEIEIVNSLTELKPVTQYIELEKRSSSDCLESNLQFHNEKSKKLKYKKDGLAYRLSVLLKKQKAHISLWQHERFLSRNSNFLIPDDFIAFNILNVCFKHGCYLLEAVDMEDRKFIILINHLYISNVFLEKDKIFKLYRPFKIVDFITDYKLIVNISKFECIPLETRKI